MQVSQLILVLTGECKTHVWHYVHLSAGFLLKRSRRVELIFTRGFGHVSDATSTMCGNPNKVFSTGNSPQLTFLSLGQHDFNNFCPANFGKRWLYTGVGQPQKTNFSTEKIILGWKSTTGKAAFRSNFKFEVGDTLNFIDLRATIFHVTL